MTIYDTRYCAFVDILGFSELIDKLDRNDTSPDILQSLLTKVHNPTETIVRSSEKADFRAQSISDAVALSGAVNVVGLAAIIGTISRLAVDLLTQGFFIRGAIVKDRLHHDEKMVFGRGLIRAYQFETNVAVYPRVIITREVVNDFRSYDPENKSFYRIFRRAEDGPMFLHVLRAIEMAMPPFEFGQDKPRSRIDDDRYHGKLMPYAGIADLIQQRFDEASDNPHRFAKVKWFAQYWNETIEQWNIEGFRRVYGPGLDPKPSKWSL